MNFGVLVFDEVEELDFVGPWEMLTMWSKVADGPARCIVVAESARPDVDVVEARYVQDDKVWSSAGVSAGMDLMLAFIASVAGEDAAGKVRLSAEYYPSGVRYGGYEGHAQAPAYLAPPL